ncbi:MAG: DNA polymerase I [Thermoleophilia bacterium]|jgi:DNA polymerase-1|nr:DNA polymerase I [Thermoleophilia bacterium]
MTPDDLTRRLFLLDGSSLAYRAYFALPETIATRDGFPTNAIYGLSQMFLKIVTEYSPCAVVVAWDAREKTFRHEEYEEYKAQRPHMPDLLSMQWDRLPELVEAFGFVNLVKGGYEADDLLGTLAVAARERGVKAAVVTGDRDSLQLVDDDIVVVATGRGITDVKVYTPARVVERFGVEPGQIPDFIGLKGDSSDNIPGVPGIGEKTAAALLQQFGSLEALYQRLDEVTSEKRRALLIEHEETARLSKRLATMVRDVPLEEDLGAIVDRCDYRVPVADVEDLFRRYEFTSLVRRLKETVVAPAESGGVPAPSGGDAGAPVGAGGAGSTAAGASTAPAAGSLPALVVERGAGALAAVLEQHEAAFAAVPAGDGDGDEWAAAVFAGGDAVVAARVGGDEWPALWRLVAHVMAYDVKALPGFAGAPRGAAYDTAVAAYLLTPERAEKDRVLENLAGLDEAGPLFDGPADEAAAATRAWLTWRVAEAQRPRLRELELDRLLSEIELPLTRVLAVMEAAGVKVDTYRLGEITARLRERVEELTDTIHELAGEPFTIGSPQQLADVLFTRLGLEPSRKGKTGYSTDARVLRGLREQHPIVPAVEEWRELTKLLSTYLEPLPRRVDPRTGRLHTTFNQTVASTGRLSSSDPNLQNIPARTELGAEIRSCFVAEEGNLLVVADYSQIELRLMAKLSGEPALLDAYARGEDVHRVTAAAVAGIPVEEVTRTQREHAKATNFGIMYGLSAYGLSEQVGMPVDEARAFIEAYFARYPKVREFRDRVIAQATQDGYVTTLFGRRRPVTELKSSNYRLRSLGERLAVNSVLQGTAADIIKVAMLEVQRRLEESGMAARLVLQVHDELVVEAPKGEVDAVKTLLGEAMRGAYEMEPVLEVEVGAGADWRSAK